MHKDYFRFKPTHKLTILGNHKPTINSNSEGIWRRILLFDCELEVKGEDINPNLLEELKEESSGILALFVQYCLIWKKEGLAPPSCVLAATEEYRSDEDHLGRFLEQYTEQSEGHKVPKSDLYNAFTNQCIDDHAHYPTRQRFNKKMKERGYNECNNKKNWLNLRQRSLDDASHLPLVLINPLT